MNTACPIRRCDICERPAFTIIEVLVCIAVLAVLVALVLPAVQMTRESARKAQCASNLRQIGLAIATYENAHQMFPPGGSYGASMHVSLLPFLEQQPLYDKYDFIKRDDSAVRVVLVPLYVCPSDPADAVLSNGVAATSYAGNCGTGVQAHGYNGMFRYIDNWSAPVRNGPIRSANITRGASHTAAVGETLHADDSFARLRVDWNTPQGYPNADQLDEFAAVCRSIPAAPRSYGWQGDPWARGFPWTEGNLGYTMYNHVLGPNQPSCFNGTSVQTGIYSAASAHGGGVNLLLADGHLQFISATISQTVWSAFGSRVSSELGF